MLDPHTDRASSANVLGRYRLIAELGQGGMAEVFLAVVHGPAGFNKLTVLKRIRPQLLEDPDFLAMFLDEARLAARLNHPHVVQTNEVGNEGGHYFIAMEYLEGQPLNRIINRIGRDRLPLAAHIKILADTLAGLHYAHDLTDYDGTPLEVVHRDMTPHNVFVTYDGQVKVVDFGIAKAMNSSSETRTGVLKGKVAYMAPEQARGEKVDRRADVFSVGVMLWEAAVGRRLWKGLPDVAILARIVNGEIPPPSSVKQDVSPELEAIILRALSGRREDRFRTAGELQAELERFLDRTGERVVLRDMGRLIAQHFEEERTKIKALVDAQLRDARTLGTDEYRAVQLPSIGRGSSTFSDSRIGRSSSYSQASSLTAASTAQPFPPSRRRPFLLPFAAASGAVLAVAIWFLARGGRTTEPPPAAPTPPAQAASPAPLPPAAPPAPVEIEIKVAAKPADARLLLDGAPLAGNPFSQRFPRDGSPHTLRVEAPGYLPDTRTLTFDKDLQVELALEREPPASPTARPGPAGPSQHAPPEDDMKRTGPKPVRSLDTSNPFSTP